LGVIHLSSKYQFPKLLQRLLPHLESCFPAKLDDFLNEKTRSKNLDGYEIPVINLARREGIHRVMPTAMYKIAAQAPDTVFLEGVELLDGSRSYLNDLDARNCLLARSNMRLFVASRVVLPAFVCSSCDCLQQRRQDAIRCHEDLESRKLGAFHGEFWKEVNAASCKCKSGNMRKEDAKRLRKDAWDSLPKWMGFGSWDNILVS